jgi:hypothetical protein
MRLAKRLVRTVIDAPMTMIARAFVQHRRPGQAGREKRALSDRL